MATDKAIDEQFELYMQTASYSEVTKHLYRCRFRQLANYMKRLNRQFIIDQNLVNHYFAMLKNSRNPGAIGFIKAYLKCYDPDNELKIRLPKILGRRVIEEDKVRHTFLEGKDIANLLKYVIDPQLRIMIRIYAETGLRATELLDWSAYSPQCRIDWQRRVISGVGKYGKPYNQPFSTKTAVELKSWILFLKTKTNLDYKTPFKFYCRKGTPYANQHGALWKRLDKICRQRQLQHIHPHMFRHFVGHNLRIKHQFDLEQIRKYLRHTKLETTKIYASATDEELYEKMNEEVFK